jgi:transposase
VDAAVPGGHWKILTILGALSITGMLASMTVEAATDGDIQLDFLDAFLCPKLRAGDVLVMDNLNVHKVEGVLTRVEAVGARLLYLPPYSPDLNPIEEAWSKLKQIGPGRTRYSTSARRHRNFPFANARWIRRCPVRCRSTGPLC